MRYAGDVNLDDTAITLLAQDGHAFEKIVRAMAAGKPYYYNVICQSSIGGALGACMFSIGTSAGGICQCQA